MKELMQNRKANAFALIAALGLLLAGSITYLALTPVANTVYDLDRSSFSADQNETADKLQATWNVWPVLILMLVFLWAILRTLSTDTYGGFR